MRPYKRFFESMERYSIIFSMPKYDEYGELMTDSQVEELINEWKRLYRLDSIIFKTKGKNVELKTTGTKKSLLEFIPVFVKDDFEDYFSKEARLVNGSK